MDFIASFLKKISYFGFVGSILFYCLSFYSFSANSYDPSQHTLVAEEAPRALQQVGVKERLGEKIDLDLNFVNEEGETVPLRQFFDGNRPVLLTLVYFECPGLCNFHLNGLTDVLKKLKWTVGEEFEFLTVSFDSSENAELAKGKKKSHLKAYGRDVGDSGWHFLTGDKENTTKLSEQVGFSYQWDEESQQWAHAAVAYVLSPDGTISRYLYGIGFEPETLRLSLVEASEGKVGGIVDKLILYCFQYDPKKSKYTLYAYNVMRAGGIVTVIFLLGLLVPFWYRQRRQAKQ